MLNNNSGKVFTIFLVIIAILLISLTAISMFFFMEEAKLRESAEAELAQLKTDEASLRKEFEETQKKLLLEEQKNTEAEEKIGSLMDDLELEEGVKEEIRKENQSLREELKTAKEAEGQTRDRMNGEISQLKGRVSQLERELIQEKNRNLELENKSMELQGQLDSSEASKKTKDKDEIDLKRIIISPDTQQGRILSIDVENEFIIFNLGEQDGVEKGMVVSIYRGQKYLGDSTVTRVQTEMSAADFIPPLTGRKVRKNDLVIMKQ